MEPAEAEEVRGKASLGGLAVMVALLATTFTTPVEAFELGGPRARLTMRYTDATDAQPGPSFERFLYPELGFTFINEYLFVDLNTPMPLVLVDGIISAFIYLGGGSDDIALMAALNPSELEPGWITIVELSGGPQVARFGDLHVGVGAHFEYSWQFPYFAGERVNISPVDFGVRGNAWFAWEPLELEVGLIAGNGWHRFGSFNPFVTVAPAVDIPVWEFLSLHVSGRVQWRRVSYEDYEETRQIPVPTETVRGTTTHVSWAVEAGPSFRF